MSPDGVARQQVVADSFRAHAQEGSINRRLIDVLIAGLFRICFNCKFKGQGRHKSPSKGFAFGVTSSAVKQVIVVSRKSMF
ncbi:hypothetical protein D3C86_1816720 [compost metagenome]